MAQASERVASRRFFHGGIPGLRPGDLVEPALPHIVDGCPICEMKARGESSPIDPLRARVDRVYLTTDREYARFYASKFPRGDLYSVEAIGDIEPSPEDHFPTWTAPAARVVSVYSRYVELTVRERRRLLKRWKLADRAALEARA